MAQLVIPSFSKLELAFPDAVFELYQQMKSKDSLSFQALGSQDVIYNINMKKLEGFISQFQIESADPEVGVLELREDSWRCEIKGITSEAFLLPGNVTSAADSDEETEEDFQGLVSTSNDQVDLASEETPKDTILAAMATTVTTDEMGTHLELPKQENEETATMESIIPDIMPLDGITMVTPGDPLVQEMDGEEGLLLEADVPQEEASDGNTVVVDTEIQGRADEGGTENAGTVEIVFGKNKKITLNWGSETQVVREEEIQEKHDKMVQSEVTELLGNEDQQDDDPIATSTFNLDMTLTEAAIAVDKAQDAVKELIERQANEKFIDQNCHMAKFPIIMEGNKYKCHVCGLLLIKKHYLVAHMRYVHKICVRDPLSRLQCPKCDQTFVRKNRLDEHVAHKHSDRKEHLCDIAGCDMAFKTIYNLRDHKRIYHYHMLRYACDICGKLYENPNTAERHRHVCSSKNPEKYGKKSAEQLRNPDWVPVDVLFTREPLPKKHKHRHKDVQLKKEHETQDSKEVKYESSENISPIMDATLTSPGISPQKTPEKVIMFSLKVRKGTEQMSVGTGIKAVKTEKEQEEEVASEDCGKTTEDEINLKLGKRSIKDTTFTETPFLKKMKSEGENEETKLEEDLECTQTVAMVNIQHKKTTNPGSSDNSDSSHSNLEGASENKPSKAAQMPLKDLLKFLKRKEAETRKQQESEERAEEGWDEGGSEAESKPNDIKSVKPKPSFSVTGILNKHKVYPLKLDELRRRIYGPETLNSVALMSFINKTEHWNKMAELKRQLTEIGFIVPRFTAVTSSFTKLCEGEIADIFTDIQELQRMYLKPGSLEKSLINRLLASPHESSDLATWLVHTRDLLQSFQNVLFNDVFNHLTDFDQATHTLAKRVFSHFLSLYKDVLTEAGNKFERRQAFYEDMSGTAEVKEQRSQQGSCSTHQPIEVQSLLSIKNASYHVTIDEIQRRALLPEQMSISLLQQYVHKTKDKLDLERECEGQGVLLQRGNRTQVKSCLSHLVEAEANKLCTDFELLFDDHVDLDSLTREFVNSVFIETKRGQFIQMLQNFRYIAPHLEDILQDQCQDFDLVSHGIGTQLADFTWSTLVKVIDQARDLI